jgi:hypothetical protein
MPSKTGKSTKFVVAGSSLQLRPAAESGFFRTRDRDGEDSDGRGSNLSYNAFGIADFGHAQIIGRLQI